MINERKGFPRLVSPMPFGLSGWQRCLPYLPCPPSPALGHQTGLPRGKSRLGGRGWGPLGCTHSTGCSIGLRFLTRAPGQSGLKDAQAADGEETAVVLAEERLVGSSAHPGCFPEPLFGDGELPGGVKPSPGRAENSQTWHSAPLSCLGYFLLIIIYFFQTGFCYYTSSLGRHLCFRRERVMPVFSRSSPSGRAEDAAFRL